MDVLINVFKERAEKGTAVVIVTHDKRISDAADTVLSLHNGKLEEVESL